MAGNCSKTATYVLAAILVIIVVIFIILLATGNLHFGKSTPPTPPPPPPPPPYKATCGEYTVSPNTCTGARTSSGQTCVVDVKEQKCVPQVPPPIPPKLEPKVVGDWFLANQGVPVPIRSKNQFTGFVVTHTGVSPQGNAGMTVLSQRFNPDDLQQDNPPTILNVQTSLGFERSTGAATQDVVPIQRLGQLQPPEPHQGRASVATLTMMRTIAASNFPIVTPTDINYSVDVGDNFGVTRFNRQGQVIDSLPPITV